MKILPLLLFTFSGVAQWTSVDLGTTASFRSMDVVNKKVIWAGGTAGTVIKSVDGGKNWFIKKVGETGLDFRGIAAFNKKQAVIVSAGLAENGAAKIFRTGDGGQSWKLVFDTSEEGVFLDGVCFLDKKNGFVFGDALGNEVYLLETLDGGNSWTRIPAERLPKVKPGSASFAASNSGMVHFDNQIWYAFQSQLLYSSDAGFNWELIDTGFPSGESNGIFGVHFVDQERGFLLGGDYLDDKADQINMAVSLDGGQRWQLGKIEPSGLKESAASYKNTVLATGTSGTSISINNGMSWKVFDETPYHVVRCAGKYCFAIGAEGRFGLIKLD